MAQGYRCSEGLERMWRENMKKDKSLYIALYAFVMAILWGLLACLLMLLGI